jgi:hypothetical protein
LDKDGNIKRRKPGFFRRMFGLQGKQIVMKHHNIVTRQGDALIADAFGFAYKNESYKCKRFYTGWYWLDREQYKE